MRRELLEWLPALTRNYGLRPWEVELLTFDELDRYLKPLTATEEDD